jgi:hypothetical protein
MADMFLCTSCGSEQAHKNPMRDPFIQNGQGGGGNEPIAPCKYCGGVVIYLENRDDRDKAMRSHFKKLGMAHLPGEPEE